MHVIEIYVSLLVLCWCRCSGTDADEATGTDAGNEDVIRTYTSVTVGQVEISPSHVFYRKAYCHNRSNYSVRT